MQIICFEDRHVDRLAPITHARPAYAITCASHRLIDWLKRLVDEGHAQSVQAMVRDYLLTLQQLDHQIEAPSQVGQGGQSVMLVNARLAPTVAALDALRKLAKRQSDGVIVDERDQAVLAAVIGPKELQAIEKRAPTTPLVDALLQTAGQLPAITETTVTDAIAAFYWPHDVIETHMAEMQSAMQFRIDKGDYEQRQDGVFVRPGVKIGDYESIHVNDGPIVLEEGVQIGPFCFLEGPVYVGANTRMLEHSAIKDGVSLGHTVKIGGEVEASIIEPYTNKQHHGFLGHSYLGSWINLGAGTCNSDLKNTYGKINIEYGDTKVATGMQFLGCVMGDYSKTAINTGIFTGKVIGVCSMMYGFITANVPSYVNYARLFGQTSLLPADVMISTQQRMFARRKVQQRDCDKQLIIDMYERTENERESEQIGF
ncbi:putative sugar nucleotidyl transferase [Crateriforma conspicua]|uniref:putative sugar nucleotidyl transferase n=1 Tax=Crateriforma conspicua TaxID=2527996 RepID=UPI00118BD0F7|nr:putative sugar nucleotidyl transferase [Crateriforma conspicua]QDV64348.1 Bifunctional protein GlmU [Crateriforma conspicua]